MISGDLKRLDSTATSSMTTAPTIEPRDNNNYLPKITDDLELDFDNSIQHNMKKEHVATAQSLKYLIV